MSALTRKVVKDIIARKLRTILTILGIAIGVMGLSAISIASSQFKHSFEYSTDLTAQPDIQFYTSATMPTLANTLLSQPNVKTVQAQGSITTRWSLPAHPVLIEIIGCLDFQHMQINRFELVEGRLPGSSEIALESSARSLSNVQIGDSIKIQVGADYQQVTVSGFVRTRGLPSAGVTGQAQGYMAESDFETLFSRQGVTNFAVRLDDYAQRYTTARELSRVFAQQNVTVKGMDIGHDESVTNIADGLFAMMNALSGIAILLSVILLLGTIGALITEQVRSIGTMKAIGGTRGKLMRHYLTLVLVYSLFGTAIGVGLGIGGGYYLAAFLGSLVNVDIGALEITPWQLGTSVAIGIAVPLVATILPVYQGTRITVRQALSGYGIENGTARTGLWSAFSHIAFRLFSQTTQFGVRSLFRKRTRTLLTLMTLVFAGASFLAVQTASYSFDNLLKRVYTTYRFDVRLSISEAQPLSKFQEILGRVQDVGTIEQLSQNRVSTQWGDATLTGVQQQTQLYALDLVTGRWFLPSDRDVVLLSQDAADKSGLGVGDTISFNTPLKDARWTIIGIVNDLSGVGPGNLGAMLAPIGQVNTFNNLPADVSYTVMIGSTGGTSATETNKLATRIDDVMSNVGFIPNVITASQQVEQDHNKYQIIYILFDAVALVIGLVGAISLSNALAMSVLERRREIGILRAMGAVGRKVAQVFWAEGMTLGLLAWTLAMLVGFPAAYGFVLLQAKFLAPVPFAFDPLNLAWMLVAVVLLVSLASVGPVFAATRVRIVQTLRYE